MTFAELIADSIRGWGKLNNDQIYSRVRKTCRTRGRRLSPHWKATVRNTMQRHSKQSGKFCHPYLFVHHNRSLWECRK